MEEEEEEGKEAEREGSPGGGRQWTGRDTGRDEGRPVAVSIDILSCIQVNGGCTWCNNPSSPGSHSSGGLAGLRVLEPLLLLLP